MATSNTQSSTELQSSSSTPTRAKFNPAWEHFSLVDEQGKDVYVCLYCGSKFRGGGIYRMKHHLAGKTGQIASCKKVPHDVRCQMKAILDELEKRKKRKKNDEEATNEAYAFDEEIEDIQEEEVQEITISAKKQSQTPNEGKRRKDSGVNQFFAPRTTPGSQPSLNSIIAGKDAIRRAHMTIARWFFDACIPLNAIQSPYFQPALDAIAAIGPGFKAPSYYDLRVNLLGDCKKECQLLVDKYRSNWANTGCTIMADGWTDQRQRTLINFLVYCPASISFVKSVDASDVVKEAKTLFNLFSEVIEWVGPTNVVHVVTDNAANYVAAGKLIHEKYDNIYWSPCAAHCLNLLLKDIGSLPHVSDLASRASKVTKFVYNHMIFLSWLRKRPGWKEIVRPGVTRFATTFITLKSLHDHMHDLQALVTDKYFTTHRLGKSETGKVVAAIVLDQKFWDNCLAMVKIAAPIIRLLRIVDADEKPSLGYVYEGMQRAKKAIKEMFRNKKRLYQPYTQIIKSRWDKHLRQDLHAAAYFLNPAFFYDEHFVEDNRVMQGLLDLLEKKSICKEPRKAMQEIKVYRERHDSFSRQSALDSCKTMQPGKNDFDLCYVFYFSLVL